MFLLNQNLIDEQNYILKIGILIIYFKWINITTNTIHNMMIKFILDVYNIRNKNISQNKLLSKR